MPKDIPELRPPGRVTNLPNLTATLQLTEQLAEVAPIM